ncbi:MAG: DUF4136 domain-containing protein [Sphingomonadaceae bacterium]
MVRISTLIHLVAPLALIGLSGCATPFKAQVSRFQALPVPQGQTFAVVPSDPKRAGSLEFARYADLVSKKLSAVGYSPAADSAAANLIVTLDYGVDDGKEKTRASSYGGYGSYYGGFGGYYGGFGRGFGGYSPYYGYGGRGYIYGFYDPFLFGSGFGGTETYTVYTSGLNLTIARKGGDNVFEGKAQAMSSVNNLTYLVPNLVEAMFTGFPGNSGETVKITVAPPSKR